MPKARKCPVVRHARPMEEIDIWRSAAQLMKQYGEEQM
jgi:hypothetical protein